MQFSHLFSFFVQKSFLVFVLINFAVCLFEDQAGKFDWRQQYIGKVKFTYIDPITAGAHKFIVATDKNVLACLSTRTGSIIWRQILEKGKTGEINAMTDEKELITISGNGQFVRSWDVNTGVLLWETSFPRMPKKDAHLHFMVNAHTKEAVMIEISPGQQAKISVYNYFKLLLKSDAIETPWYDESSACDFISNSYFVCLDRHTKHFYIFSVQDDEGVYGRGGSFSKVPFSTLGINYSNTTSNIRAIGVPYQGKFSESIFGFQVDQSIYIMQIQLNRIVMLNTFTNADKITSAFVDGKRIIFSITYEDSLYSVKALEYSEAGAGKWAQSMIGEFTLSEDRGLVENFFICPYVKKDHELSYKFLLLFEDHSVLLIHQQGRMVWSREEALSSIISSEIMDLPLSETDANIEQEFGHPDAGLISMFLTRLKSQIYLLQTFLLKALIGFKGESNMDGSDKKTLSRDTFGLHKIIVILTKPGKTFGIDNLSGLIIWSHFEKNLAPFTRNGKPYLPLFVQRTTAHFPYPPICTAFGMHAATEESRIYSFNPITGATLESKILPYRVAQVMPVGSLTNYLREILILDSNLMVHIYPESHDILRHVDTHFIFTADPDSGLLTGYSLNKLDSGNSLKATEVWKVLLPQKIIKVVTKNPLEHVHSQGRVMGDRSVLYKYLNPNLAVVVTEGNDVIHKSFCNIYLVDVITGLIIYSASHKRCKDPVHVVHSENWVVYSFYNDKSRRVEISSIELFEGIYQSNTTAFSSFAPPPLPHVEHQTFIFPSAIEVMAVTITERGMTSKHILIALPSGGILELPKTFLDPRRPINPLPEHREEGLIPYIPELPIVSESIVNYNQSVMGVEGIVTAPSGLESTCLVFVHGLDLLYTRVTPSKTFDILKDDFDHSFICVVLLALLVVSYISKRFAARRTLRAAWK